MQNIHEKSVFYFLLSFFLFHFYCTKWFYLRWTSFWRRERAVADSCDFKREMSNKRNDLRQILNQLNTINAIVKQNPFYLAELKTSHV